MIPNPHPQSRPQVRAMYTHQANSDTQLSFMEGDILALIGDKKEGWHYGENLSTHRYVDFYKIYHTLVIVNSEFNTLLDQINSV